MTIDIQVAPSADFIKPTMTCLDKIVVSVEQAKNDKFLRRYVIDPDIKIIDCYTFDSCLNFDWIIQ